MKTELKDITVQYVQGGHVEAVNLSNVHISETNRLMGKIEGKGDLWAELDLRFPLAGWRVFPN